MRDSGSVDVTPRAHGPAECGLCHDTLAGDGVNCPDCRASYHAACLTELGPRCATLGCGRELGSPVEPMRVEAPGTPVSTPADTRPRVFTPTVMSPKERIGMGSVVALLGLVCLVMQIVVTAKGDWAEPAPTWWQLVISFFAFGVLEIALGAYVAVGGLRQLRRDG